MFFTAKDFEKLTAAYIAAEDAISKAQTFERDDWTFVLQPLFEKVSQAPLNVRYFAFSEGALNVQCKQWPYE